MTLPALSRRRFLAALGLAGAGAFLGAPLGCSAPQPAAPAQSLDRMPTRPLGHTGIQVPILSFGCVDLQPGSRILLRRAMDLGATLWETGASYGGGASERAIGEYLQAFPRDRDRLLLLTKSTAFDPDGLERELAGSLERLGVDRVDFYLLHGVDDAEVFTPELGRWVEQARSAGRFRAFGLATHKNMAPVLTAAAEHPWIDLAMVACSYRHLQEEPMRRALDACQQAGVGLIAMKTQGLASLPTDPQAEGKLLERFVAQGRSLAQARLQAVWAHPAIACICSKMPNVAILEENTAAAKAPTALGAAELEALREHALATAPAACSGCGVCQRAAGVPGAEIMRALMYTHGYGEPQRARALLGNLPSISALEPAALAQASGACPRRVPLAQAAQRAAAQLTPESTQWPAITT